MASADACRQDMNTKASIYIIPGVEYELLTNPTDGRPSAITCCSECTSAAHCEIEKDQEKAKAIETREQLVKPQQVKSWRRN